MKPKIQVRLRAIAEEAGVTTMSVSNALTGKGRMSDENRERIRRIANEMGYRLILQTRSMQTGKSRLIGVMVPLWGAISQSLWVSMIH